MRKRMLGKNPKIYLATEAVDMRKSINGLAAIVEREFQMDLYEQAIFVFSNRTHDKVKLLQWDKDGFIVLYKRREKGRFAWPDGLQDGKTNAICRDDLNRFLDGLVMEAYQKRRHWITT